VLVACIVSWFFHDWCFFAFIVCNVHNVLSTCNLCFMNASRRFWKQIRSMDQHQHTSVNNLEEGKCFLFSLLLCFHESSMGFLGQCFLEHFCIKDFGGQSNFWKEEGLSGFKVFYINLRLWRRIEFSKGNKVECFLKHLYIKDYRGKSSFWKGENKANGLEFFLIIC
jgi:hypothetical protein